MTNWDLLSNFVLDFMLESEYDCISGTPYEDYDFENLTDEQMDSLFTHGLVVMLEEEPELFVNFVKENIEIDDSDKIIH